MKLMDENGRLFGKISIIDVLVVGVVLVLAVALNFKSNQTQTGTSVTSDTITYQVLVSGVRNYVADTVSVDDLLYDLDHNSGGALGKIVAIEETDGTKFVELQNGYVGMVPAEDSVNLLLTVEGRGVVSDGRVLINRVYDLGVNSARNYHTKFAQFTGTVVSIG